MKKFRNVCLIALILASLSMLVGCGAHLPSAGEVQGLVRYPDQYSITYEVKSKGGVITEVQKTVDCDGNVYFKSGETEELYIKDRDVYVQYLKEQDGRFVAQEAQSYDAAWVAERTAQFSSYAEQSRNQLLPSAQRSGSEQVLDRACDVYTVGVGGEKTGVRYYYYVDRETGICMGYESSMSAMGFDLGADGDVFRCVEFIVGHVPSLELLLNQ